MMPDILNPTQALFRVEEMVSDGFFENSYYDDALYFNSQKERYGAMLSEIDKTENKKVLDIGCSPGHISVALDLMGLDVFGLDLQEQTWHSKVNFEVVLSNAEKEKLPFEDSFFDYVILGELLEHFVVDPTKILSEIRRVLVPGGKLILTTPNIACLGRTLKLISGKNVCWPVEGFYDPDKSKTHVREYTKDEVSEVLLSSGFKAPQLTLIEYGRATNKRDKFRYVLALPIKTIIPRFRGCIMATATK